MDQEKETTTPPTTSVTPPQTPIITTDQVKTPAITTPQTTAPVQSIPPIAAPEKGTSAWAVIGLLITFPPAAWALMWKNKRFHSWFHKILLIYGILGVFGVINLYFSIPEITRTYQSLGLSAPSNLGLINKLNAVFSLLQIGYAIYMWNKLRSHDINIFDVIFSGGIIFVPFLIMLYLTMITFLTPIYNLSPQIQQNYMINSQSLNPNY